MDNERSARSSSSSGSKLQVPIQPRKRHPSISRNDIKGKDGFIIEKNERDFLNQQFLNDQALAILNKGETYQVPEGHFLYGKKIPFDIIKDNNGNIFAVHDGAKLGKGAFGNVVTIQCIQAQNPSMVGEYYALKLQKPTDKEELDNIKKEMQIAGKFDLLVGELEIQRDGKTIYFTVMPLLAGKELAKNTTSYEGYEVKPIVIDSDKKAVREELGKGIQSLLWTELPPTPRIPNAINVTVSPSPSPDKITNNTTKLSNETTRVANDTTRIANDTTRVASDTTRIVNDTTRVASDTTRIVNDTTRVASDTTRIANDTTRVASDTTRIVNDTTRVASDTTRIVNDTTRVASDTTRIANDTTRVASDTTRIANDTTRVVNATTINNPSNASITVPPDVISTAQKIEATQQKPPMTQMIGDPNSFEVERWLTIFQKMASEIERCHAVGVLHLDIKPENFMYDPTSGSMKMIDFGLSLPINEVNKRVPSDLCQGTPGFMAPEFFKFGFQEAISTKQDIYALGRSFDLLFYQQMAKMVGYEFIFRSELGPDAVLKKGEFYVGREASGQFNYTVMTPEGKWVTENMPKDFPIQYVTSFGREVNSTLENLPPEDKLTDSMKQGLALGLAKYAIEKGHLSSVPFPYEPSLPPGILSTDLPKHFPKNSLITNHFKNFRLENKENDPRVSAMNDMIEVVHAMQNPNVAERPEASAVRMQLAAIQTKLQQQIEEKAVLKQIIREAPQEKTGILQLRAISMLVKKYNKDVLEKWEKQPESKRGPKPVEIKISSLDAIKTLMQEVQNDIAKEKQQQVDNIANKKAREEYEKNHAANDYQLYKEIRLDLTKEINQLMIKRKGMTTATPAELAHVDKILESKQLQLKNAEVEIRTYERKHLSEFELKTNPLSAFAHMVQDIDKDQKQPQKNNAVTITKEIVGHTNPMPVMFDDVKHHALHHANNQSTYKQQVSVAPLQQVQVTGVAKNPEIEAIKVELQAFKAKLSAYKQHTDVSAQHQQNSLLGSALNFLGKVDKSDKSELAQNLIKRVDGLLQYADSYKSSDELNRKFLGVCQDGIDANVKIHKGKVSAAEKSDLYDICNDTKKALTSQQHLKQKK